MTAPIVVFDYGEPRQKLMAWLLFDSGLASVRVVTIQDLQHALVARPKVLIVNSTASTDEIAALVANIRAMDGGDLRIIALHDGKHREDEALIDADICLHSVHDVDDLIEVTRAAVADDVPDIEPHAAGEELLAE